MVDAIIFTRDRPMQLGACLESLSVNAGIDYPRVIWKATTPRFRAGYLALWRDLGCSNRWMEEGDFATDVRFALSQSLPLVLLQCDDAITYRQVPDVDMTDALEDDVLMLTLRLGANTHYCHPRDLLHDVPELLPRDPFVVWDWNLNAPEGHAFEWQGREGDFGYPYSVDGTVHRRDSIIEWIGSHEFVNPNRMEGCVVGAIGRRTDVPQLLASYPLSVQVGLPINVVNQTHGNHFGNMFPRETAELNERFLDGERIRWQEMDYGDIIGAHQEIELVIR